MKSLAGEESHKPVLYKRMEGGGGVVVCSQDPNCIGLYNKLILGQSQAGLVQRQL